MPDPTAAVVPPSAVASPRAPATAPEPAHATEPTVHEELGMLEQARSALAAGDAARTLAILDGYAVTFPHPSMAPEATVLRIEALMRAGDAAAAHRVGDAFLAGQPQSPYAERVRSLLGESNP
jgi:outer membrane protein assembly factor BamD (BamD/ComL family)